MRYGAGGKWAPLYVLLLAGCAGALPAASTRAGPTGDAPRRVGAALVLSGAQLQGQSGTLLGVLMRRFAGMQVRNSAGCPEITLRGRTSIFGPSDPDIYVDGTRAVNTCVLDTMNVRDVERIEVYPMGVSSHAEYRADPDGLILVFLRAG